MPIPKLIKENLIPITIVIAVIGTYVFLKCHEKATEKEVLLKKSAIEYDVSDAGKTTDTLEKFGLCANENFVVRQDAEVRRTPNIARYNTIYNLRFGTKVYTKNLALENPGNIEIDASLIEKETKNGFVAIYSVKPITLSDMPVGYMLREDIIEKSEFKNFKPLPEKAPALLLPSEIQAVIESNLTIDGTSYTFIEDEERYNNSLSYGDYNNDGTTDFAIVLDKADHSESILLVYGMNANKNAYSQIYKKIHAPLLAIKTVLKNTKTTVNYEPTAFAIDGIYITNMKMENYFQVFDATDKSFMVFKN